MNKSSNSNQKSVEPLQFQGIEGGIQQAEELLKLAKKKQVEECASKVEEVLKDFNCTMMPQIVIQGDRIIAHVVFVPT